MQDTSARILSINMGAFVSDCYRGESAPCRVACPLNLDIPEFIARIRRGNINSAYNLLRDYVVFPEIARKICGQPCMDICARKDTDRAVELGKLERAAAEHSGSTAPVRYNAPKKNQAVAIVGAGLCGLTCTVRLASRGYDVTLFEKTAGKGGRLADLLPDEIELQMSHIDYEFRPETAVTSLDELKGYDAILLASGPEGNDFGLAAGMNNDSLGSSVDGIFLGGGLIGSSSVESIENGIRASQSIESYLKIGRMHEMTGISVKKPSRLKINPILFQPLERPDADVYTKEQAMREAAACPPCDCSDCVRSCDFMQAFNRQPKSIVNNVKVRLNPVEGLEGSKGTRMINSCNACGLCAEACSESINMGDFLLETRAIMHREGTVPPAFHDFWMRDMRHAQSEKSYLARRAPGTEKASYLFFPGCQLGASDPDYIKRSYEYLHEKLPETGILLSCCGAPAMWAGDTGALDEVTSDIRKVWEDTGNPELVIACPSCAKTLGKYLPEIKLISLYEVIASHGLPFEQPAGGTVSVFDPCSSRYAPDMQMSVRELARSASRDLCELSAAGKDALCCGYGGNIYSANKKLAEEIAMSRINLGTHPFVTYCVNCRDIFSRSGKTCGHILDLVFGRDFGRPVPSFSEKRMNRESLKKDLLLQVWGQDTKMEENEYEIILTPELSRKLDDLLILEDDVRETILSSEKDETGTFDPQTGYTTGHRKIGVVTYWVEYKIENGSYIVKNAYSHRMAIEGE